MASIADLSPVFIDFEASALHDGYPIEIGWAFADGAHVISESHLILPDLSWDIDGSWDPRAEEVHGISIDQLRADGKPAFKVAQRLNEALAGRELFADSPFDRQWLGQLFEAAGADPSFNMRTMLAPALVDQLCLSLGLNDSEIRRITEDVHRKYPHVHRAAQDARQWAELWRAMKGAPSR